MTPLIRAQTATPTTLDPAGDSKEQYELAQAVSEAGTSAIDRIRAFEQHLKKYPESKQRAGDRRDTGEIGHRRNDNDRIVLYGEKSSAAELAADDDVMQILDRVIRALVDKSDPERRRSAPWRTRNATRTMSPTLRAKWSRPDT